jgi:hypothetical protein
VNRPFLIAVVVLLVIGLLAIGYMSRHNEAERMEQGNG